MVSGAHWYIKQNVRLPWYDEGNSLELEFLLDTGASDPMMAQKDLLDLGLIGKKCPHVSSRRISTALGIYNHDFYPLFINHLDSTTGNQLYPPMDTVVGVLRGSGDRLSGLDLWRFCYVASEPSTGKLTYHPKLSEMKLRYHISPGGTMTPRAWYTRVWDKKRECFRQSTTHCFLAKRPPRLLNPLGERWVHDEEYEYQFGRPDRTPPYHIGYIPGHKVHAPTPDSIRDDRKYYWHNNWDYRDDRPRVSPRRTNRPLIRDEYYAFQTRPMPRPLNPWQYKEKEEGYHKPIGDEWVQPKNPLGVRYWDKDFKEKVVEQGLSKIILPKWQSGERIEPRKYAPTESYWEMRNPKRTYIKLLPYQPRSSFAMSVVRPQYLETESGKWNLRKKGQKKRGQHQKEREGKKGKGEEEGGDGEDENDDDNEEEEEEEEEEDSSAFSTSASPASSEH